MNNYTPHKTFNEGANIYQISNKHVQSHKLTIKKYNPKSYIWVGLLLFLIEINLLVGPSGFVLG
jgi:hypothetical protein